MPPAESMRPVEYEGKHLIKRAFPISKKYGSNKLDLKAIVFHKSKTFRRFRHPQTHIVQLVAPKHGAALFCFHFAKVRLEVFNAAALGQFRNNPHVCAANQFFFQIQNLRQENDFQLSTIPGKKLQILLKV
ncbi:hypothetical protein HMPREF1986_01772 [Oribacterium sp. oral taxon 078 str. F0263]|nr:hypothetical protein GCWU000341_02739 [Oribacterium sp. oral taxon 078 str. F0262]ERL20968.1 hypothetical protein HMPREF1986_01772 [Oribacterium sp. oral taxon 078 str. F0263]